MISGTRPLASGDPRNVGPYVLDGVLGSGGMGRVYLGRTREGRRVAVKVIKEDLAAEPEYRQRFRREAEAARKVARFCTAEVLDADADGPRPYLVTEYLDGPTLLAAINDKGPLAPVDLERVAVAVAAALTAIHGAGLVHRDLKPGNVVLSSLGPRVIDFGIARALDSTTILTHDGSIGTPSFMAPEQALNEAVTAAADIFAWGSLVLFAATAQLPFGNGPAPSILYRIVHSEPDLSSLHAGLRAIAASAMCKNPLERPNARELLALLLGLQPGAAAPLAHGGEQALDPSKNNQDNHVVGTEPDMISGSAVGQGATPTGAAPTGPADMGAPVTLGDAEPVPVSGGTGTGAARRPVRGTTRVRGGGTGPGGTTRGSKNVGGGNRGRQAVAKGRGDDAETQRNQPAQRRRRVPFVLAGLAGVALAALVAVLLVSGRTGEPSPADTASGSGGGGSAQPAASGGEPPATQPRETQQTPQNQTPEERWRAALIDLDAARVEAFETGDEALLGRVYAPGSTALAQDTQALRTIVANGAHRKGGGHEIEAIEVREEGTERVVLRVTQRQMPSSYVAEDGAVLREFPGAPPQTLDVHLVNTADGWQIVQFISVAS